MLTFLFCLVWLVLSVYFLLLVRIGAQPVPHPPDLSPYCDGVAFPRNVVLYSTLSCIGIRSATRK
jgi:hypothetical protein